jgi:hypothetical protein
MGSATWFYLFSREVRLFTRDFCCLPSGFDRLPLGFGYLPSGFSRLPSGFLNLPADGNYYKFSEHKSRQAFIKFVTIGKVLFPFHDPISSIYLYIWK